MLQQYDDILTASEACQVLKIRYNTLYDLLNSGKLKAYKSGRVWKIPKISVETYILESAGLAHKTYQSTG